MKNVLIQFLRSLIPFSLLLLGIFSVVYGFQMGINIYWYFMVVFSVLAVLILAVSVFYVDEILTNDVKFLNETKEAIEKNKSYRSLSLILTIANFIFCVSQGWFIVGTLIVVGALLGHVLLHKVENYKPNL